MQIDPRLRGRPTVQKVAVGSTATPLLGANPGRHLAYFAVVGNGTLYLGTTNQVATTNGFPVTSAAYFVDVGSCEAWFGVAAAADGTLDVRVAEIGGAG